MISLRRPIVAAGVLAGLLAMGAGPALGTTKPAPAPKPAAPPPRPQAPMRVPAPVMQPARPMAQPARPAVQTARPLPQRVPNASQAMQRPAATQRSATAQRSPTAQARRPVAPVRPDAAARLPGAGEARGAAHPASAQHAAFPGPHPLAAARPDPRIVASSPALHVRGLDHGLALARAEPPRAFLRPAARRDEAAERSFIDRHAAAFHTREVRDLSAGELAQWRAGRWRNEWHYGRRGWWYEVDGGWYSYAEPVYPYPADIVLPVVYEAPVLDGPDLSVQEGVTPEPAEAAGAPVRPAAVAQAGAPDIPPLPPAPVGWYKCVTPSGYYPGVASCGTSWDLVQNAPLPGEQ